MKEMPTPPKQTKSDAQLAGKALSAIDLPRDVMLKEQAKLRMEVEAEKAKLDK